MEGWEVLPLPLATVAFPAGHPLAGQTGVVNAFALRRPGQIVLIDTGIGRGSQLIDQLYRPRRRRLVPAFNQRGLRPEDVVAIINTHLHFDHCGGNVAFPGVPTYVQAAEYAAAQQPNFTVNAWVNFPGANYQLIDGEQAIRPGVTLLPTAGHTPGHQSVAIETAGGLAVIAGQALYAPAEYEHIRRTGALRVEDPPPDPESYLASALRLIGLGASRVYFSHDSASWQRDA